MILVADSGSSKTDWAIIGQNEDAVLFSTEGLNPVFCSDEKIISVLKEDVLPRLGIMPSEIFFYGAGVLDSSLGQCLAEVFPEAEIHCESDLLGAVRAVCGSEPGIACILGTGSNSCFYDGTNIVNNVKAGGFILGDEASGAYIGKMLIADFIKGLMPKHIEEAFKMEYALDYPTIVQKVYKEAMPNRYLASFSPFIFNYKMDTYIKQLLKTAFNAFISRNLVQYDYQNYNVNFIGSIAYAYKDYLQECLQERGFTLGKIIAKPMEGLVKYHA